jgi:hypothetical protein
METDKPLADLPNRDGFLFLGVTHGGAILRCRVVRESDGVHRALSRADGLRVYDDLRGWRDDPEEEAASLLRAAERVGRCRAAAILRRASSSVRQRLLTPTPSKG